MQIKRISAATTLDAAIDDVILVDASAGDVTVTIPAGVATGRTFTIKRVDTNSTNTVLISFADGTVDDTDTLISLENKVMYQIINEGANKWQTISRFKESTIITGNFKLPLILNFIKRKYHEKK